MDENQQSNIDQSNTSKHDQKELEKRQREEQRLKEQQKNELKKKSKKYSIWGLGIILLVGFVYLVYNSSGPAEPPFAVGNPIHWHAKLDITICGKVRDDLLKLGQATHAGSPALHTHGDNTIHIETNIIRKAEDIALGKFFNNVNLKFDKDKLLDKKNGDLCDGKPGQVKMSVNGKESTAFRDFVPTDGDEIKLSFE